MKETAQRLGAMTYRKISFVSSQKTNSLIWAQKFLLMTQVIVKL